MTTMHELVHAVRGLRRWPLLGTLFTDEHRADGGNGACGAAELEAVAAARGGDAEQTAAPQPAPARHGNVQVTR